MELTDTPSEAQFRQDVAEWLADVVPSIDWPENGTLDERLPAWRRWQRLMFEAGYAGLVWPEEFGGRGADVVLQGIFLEECEKAGAPDSLNILGENLAGPTIINFGTNEQKRRFLRPILTGDEIWCQLFSEPNSGSDLASLRTKAERVDGGWRITGQKIWTSRAHIASHAILLARTGGGERHRGITFFLMPMDAEGVTIRPLRHILGEAEFNEVFLDDVFIPDADVVGDVDGGWAVAMGTLAFERVAIARGRVNTRRAVEQLIADIAERTDADGHPLGVDPVIRRTAADLYGRAFVHYLIGQRVAWEAASGEPPGPVASIGKLYFTPLVDAIADFRLSLDPLGGQLDLEDDAQESPVWLKLAYQSRGSAIAGGSTFIQKNIVAERILGMPRS